MIEILRTMIAVRFPRNDERGASAVEYGLLVAGIAALIIIAVFALGGSLSDLFDDTTTSIENGG